MVAVLAYKFGKTVVCYVVMTLWEQSLPNNLAHKTAIEPLEQYYYRIPIHKETLLMENGPRSSN